MLNKLSFLPTDSLRSMRCYALDDFGDDLIGQQDAEIRDTHYTREFRYFMSLFDTENNPELNVDSLTQLCDVIPSEVAMPLNREIFSYICSIIAIGDTAGISSVVDSYEQNTTPVDCFDPKPYDKYFMYMLLQRIPILLLTEDEFKLKSPIDKKNSTEYLGCYISSSPENNNQSSIFLCPKRIEDAASQAKIDKKVLYAKVLIHELAHAIMDPTNKLQNASLETKEKGEALISDADIFMEESLANMITLQYFAAAKKKVQNFEDDSLVKAFMEHQPDAYKFGITQYELLHTDWKLWRNNKSQIKFWVDWSQKVLPNIEELRKEYSLCF